MSSKKGFTLIELIVAIAIMSVLAAIIIPAVVSNVERANESADMTHVRQLNLATQIYRHSENILYENLLTNFANDDLRQDHLVNLGYLSTRVEAKSSQYDIEWNSQLKLWIYTKFEIAAIQQAQYLFPSLTDMSIFRKGADGTSTSNNWALTSNGLVGNVGSVFLENANEGYTIETTGRLNNTSSSGGFGVYVESSLTQSGSVVRDSGYIVQFDRGLGTGEIVVRRRTNGVESSPLVRSTIGVENKNTSPQWWNQNQELKVEVSPHPTDPTKKYLNVYVNGVKSVNNFVINANEDSSQNFTGVRGWSQSSTIENLTITPKN
ncbi:MAG: type II secretion system protein [Erysipelothrix sp.]|jgi:prepilin-type N-terminal cleavage/methylation domain-containing protein|nr:type II secretion system protein [Erysipelothrix sp.]